VTKSRGTENRGQIRNAYLRPHRIRAFSAGTLVKYIIFSLTFRRIA
jgi:hypothetical protein